MDNSNFKTAVHVVSGLYDGLHQAGEQILNNVRNVAKEGVNKKYGFEAGQAVD